MPNLIEDIKNLVPPLPNVIYKIGNEFKSVIKF